MTSPRGEGPRACLTALVTRLLLPAAYAVIVGFYPLRRFDFGVGAAMGWLFISLIVVPTLVVIALLTLSGRGRSRATRYRRRS